MIKGDRKAFEVSRMTETWKRTEQKQLTEEEHRGKYIEDESEDDASGDHAKQSANAMGRSKGSGKSP